VKTLPRIDRRGWLAWWLQGRRRSRIATPSPESDLLSGLVHFYLLEDGTTHVRSWGETATVPEDPFDGIGALSLDTNGGDYSAGQFVQYYVLPFGVQDGGRLYSGAARQLGITVGNDDDGVLWPTWSASPDWVTGYCVLRLVSGAYAGYRDVTAATMFGGWTDANTGWTDASELPCDFNHPPRTAKVIWNNLNLLVSPPTFPTVASPFGGRAFDSNLGDALARVMSDDLRRSVDGTLAYWVCPNENIGVLHAVRGTFAETFGTGYAGVSGTDFGVNNGNGSPYSVTATAHVAGDWYLLVQRNDFLSDSFKMDLLRERDGAHFSIAADYQALPLNSGDDYWQNGIFGVLVFGSSWHWGVPGYGYYDRMGVWNRALTNDEILDLFNNGLGWQPA